jgi:uncharacterized membrane protein
MKKEILWCVYFVGFLFFLTGLSTIPYSAYHGQFILGMLGAATAWVIVIFFSLRKEMKKEKLELPSEV